MSILVVPSIKDSETFKLEIYQIETNIAKTIPNLSIANLYAWGNLFKSGDENADNTTIGNLVKGYLTLSNTDEFKNFDLYIGYLEAEDFKEVDAIIYEDEWAYYLFNDFFDGITLPESKDIVVVGEDSTIENEVYKRAIIYNILTKE